MIVSCGAVNSAALLLRSANDKHPDGLANSSGLVGKRYMAHLATMMQGFHPFRRNDTVFQKTVAINDFYLKGRDTPYPLGQIQSQGRTHGVMAQTVVPQVPLWAYEAWVARGVDWLAMTEDLPRAREPRHGRAERHRSACTTGRTTSSRTTQLVDETKRMLRRLGFWMVMTHSHKAKNTTHQCGTLVFGTDPRESVLDTVLPHPRRRQPLRRRRVVLPFVGRGESRPDDRGAGAARRRPHSLALNFLRCPRRVTTAVSATTAWSRSDFAPDSTWHGACTVEGFYQQGAHHVR